MENFNALLTLSELKTLYSGKPVCVCPLYNGVLNATKTFEATGNPIVIPEYKSLVKLKIDFSPKQAGTGDPSPENVRPISGWNEVTVYVRGKNFFDFSKITFSSADINLGLVAVDYANMTITVAAYRNNVGYTNSLRDLVGGVPPGTYVLNAETSNVDGERKIFILDTRKTIPFGVPQLLTEDDLNSVFSWYNNESSSVPNIISDIRFSVQPTAYEPYQGDTYDIALPETVYGGTLDAVTGVGSKTWGFIASYNGDSLPGEWISDRDVYAPGTTPTTGAQVAYKLATPEPFDVSQFSIPSLKSENTFFTNGENMDIIYKETSFWG